MYAARLRMMEQQRLYACLLPAAVGRRNARSILLERDGGSGWWMDGLVYWVAGALGGGQVPGRRDTRAVPIPPACRGASRRQPPPRAACIYLPLRAGGAPHCAWRWWSRHASGLENGAAFALTQHWRGNHSLTHPHLFLQHAVLGGAAIAEVPPQAIRLTGYDTCTACTQTLPPPTTTPFLVQANRCCAPENGAGRLAACLPPCNSPTIWFPAYQPAIGSDAILDVFLQLAISGVPMTLADNATGLEQH